MPHVIVVGAGIAGAATAWFLQQAGVADLTVTVLDGAERVGGKLRVVEVEGISFDTGAEAILNRRPEGVALARAVGLGERLVHPETTSAGLWIENELRPIPAGTVMGIPGDLDALAKSGVLTDDGLKRVGAEQPGELTDDVAVGPFVADRLGRELVDRIVEPLLGGVYAGHADRLSLQATVPQVFALAQKDSSLLNAVAAAKNAAPASDQPVFAGLDGGVGQLVPAVLEASQAKVRTRATVRELARTKTGWRLTVGPTRDPERTDADAVVLACPATPAGRLLANVIPAAATELARIDYASTATIALLFRKDAFPSGLEGSGFLVPPTERRLIKAATFSSAKWGWLGRSRHVVVRTSVGRHGEEADLQRTDAELVQGAVADLHDAVGAANPIASYVQRWGGGLPQYAVGHKAAINRIRAAVATQPGLAVAGAAYDGVGIPACIATAKAAADQVLDQLRDPERMAT